MISLKFTKKVFFKGEKKEKKKKEYSWFNPREKE